MSSGSSRRQLPNIKTDLEETATGAIYQVIKEFNARLEDELTLKIGDKVEVISDDKEYNDGWYMGKSLSTGAVGLYPKSFTRLVPSLTRPSLLRSRSRRIASPTSTNIESPLSATSSKSNLGTPTNKASKFEDSNNLSKTPIQEEHSEPMTGALSDIDRALEELKKEAKPRFEDRAYSNESTESLNPELVESWTSEQVTSYFKYLGFDAGSAEQFVKHKITGAILLELELAYLKELDISSFGTRFEIFKEIEALKEVAQQSRLQHQHTFNEEDEDNYELQQQQQQEEQKQTQNSSKTSLLAPPEVHKKAHDVNINIEEDFDTFTRPLGHTRRKSKSLDDIPETSHQQQKRLSQRNNHLQPPSSQPPELPPNLQGQFVSPRRAPNPPSYPSPIQLREERFSNTNTPLANRSSYYENVNHSRRPSYDVNPSFQFKGNHSRKSSYEPLSHSRNNSRNFKSSSVADLLSVIQGENNRPASSVYLESTHSRHSSVNLRSNGHTRRSSEVSFTKSLRDEKAHRRHSSVFSFLSPSKNGSTSPIRQSPVRQSPSRNSFTATRNSLDPKGVISPIKDRRSVSAKDAQHDSDGIEDSEVPQSPTKRSVSEAVRHKTLRNISSSTTLRKIGKKETSAFMEGIRNITPAESIKTSDCFGWINKRGGIAVGTWKQRYFTLHGTRLSYFTSLSDTRERGLIDITSHKVLPAKEDDKLVSLYAATTGHGKFCFKLVPPAPGSRKGLTFTQPKVHYFAVETKEEMRTWMAALIKATIDIDESVPVLSSCATPTVSLQKAQGLLAQARENARRREEARAKELEFNKPDISGTSSNSPDTDSFDSNIPLQSPNTTVNTSELTPIIAQENNGFSSPFDLASNAFTPNSHTSSASHSPIDKDFKSKPYNGGVIRNQSHRINSASAAAAAAALSSSYNNSNKTKSGNANRL